MEPGLRRCRCCGTDFEFLGTEDSEQLDWQVRLCRILWRRRRYRRRCQCPAKLAGRIAVCAPRPPKVIPKGLLTATLRAGLSFSLIRPSSSACRYRQGRPPMCSSGVRLGDFPPFFVFEALEPARRVQVPSDLGRFHVPGGSSFSVIDFRAGASLLRSS